MNEQLQNIQKYRLAFLIVFIGMFFTNISAQTNSLTLHDLIQGNNKIFVYDPQLIISPFLDPIPTIHQMEEMGRLIDTDGPYNNIGSTHSALWLQLFTNEDTIQPDPVKQIENLSIRVRFLKTNGRLDSTETIQLQTGYNNVSLTPYVYYNSIKIDSVVFAYIEVTGIEYEESSISPVPFNHVITGRDTIDEINSLTQIRFVAKLDPIHVYNLSTIPPINGNSFACNVSATYIDLTGDIRVDWRAAGRPGEVSYTELEWTFVSTYPDRISNPSTIYDFRMNNTAVQISSPEVHYSLPMIFEKGVLIFRYRWVSLRGDDKKPVYSAWSLPESGTIGSVRCGKFEITNERIHESDQKNWQCITSYAEEGKHKTVVTYYDGTMRSRQSVTRLSESNTVIVGETIYDFQGRPAIQVLPVPVGLSDSPLAYSTPGIGIDFAPDPSTYEAWQTAQETIIMENLGLYGSGGGSSSSIAGTEVVPDVPGQYLSQKIRYYPDFNLNNSDQPFSWRDFDTGPLCDSMRHTPSMSITKGASRYYSPDNDDQSGFNANIPDANGFPFSQTEYMPDNTGRICRQGSVGETFQLRRGHDSRFYYGAPSQDELDRLFGSDAGLAVYYKKNMMVDGNGQVAVSYVDMKGKVIASGHAGNNPSNLDPLENKWRFRNTMDLLAADVRVQNELKNTLHSTTRLLIEQDNTTVIFDYDLADNEYRRKLCNGQELCLDCQYDYTIQVQDECGAFRWDISRNLVGADILNGSCVGTGNSGQNESVVLNKGIYTISRKLTVTAASIEEYGLRYDSTSICQPVKDSLKVVGNLNFPKKGCNTTCENCNSMTYANRTAGELVMNTLNGISMPYKITQEDIDRDRDYCSKLCKKTISNLENILNMMRSDISKNGMYGETYQHFDDDTTTLDINEELDTINPAAFPLSVFNSSNQLGAGNRNWRYPSKNRFNEGGAKYYELNSAGILVESWVTIPVSRERQYYVAETSEVHDIPAGKYRIQNGRLQIKPEALRDVGEFMDAWKEEWANALLPYHPEYPSLIWYIKNTPSNDYDEKLNSLLSYHEAESFLSRITDVRGTLPQILNSDPYFLGRDAARMKIKDLLFVTSHGEERNELEIKALASAYCAIETISSSELIECLASRRLYDDPEMMDEEWQLVRALYLQAKHHIQDSLRSSELSLSTTDDRYNNGSSVLTYENPSALNIGDSSTRSSNLYWDKIMRLPTQNDIMKNMIGCPQLERTIGSARFLVPDIGCMQDRAAAMLKEQCNKCPLTQELETFLSFLASTQKLTEYSDGLIGRVISTREMITSLGSAGVRRMSWDPVFSGNQLMVTIKAQDGFNGTGTTYEHFLNLKSFDSNIQWDKLRTLRCLEHTPDPQLFTDNGKNFTLRGIDEYGNEFLLEGLSSCFILDGCKGFDPIKAGKNKTESIKSCCTPLYPAVPPINDCQENRQKLISFFYRQKLEELVEQERIELRKEYTDACLQDADEFKATLDNSVYQLTLYYYDQAGNLIRTIPPAGVDTLNREQILNVQWNRNNHIRAINIPAHNMATKYKYNTLSQIIEKTSPDAGTVKMIYDSLGRVHLSQDAVQEVSGAYHYILFNKLGRVYESGQAFLDSARVRSASGSHAAVKSLVSAARKEEVTHIYYDRPINNATNTYFNSQGPKLLRNRVSSSVFSEIGNIEKYDNATHYSYDYNGNVKTLIQENRDDILMSLGQSRKRIDYDFDLISGKTKEVCYQCDSTDQFIHRYEYDADNRITNVYTGMKSDMLQQDAAYLFYKHGPIARINLGDRLVQGIDYAYTLQGSLKGINSNSANSRNDMGGDGGTGSSFASDRYGFSLNYFTNDYLPIATGGGSFLADPGSTLTRHLEQKGLFNGNIASTALTLNDVSEPAALLHLYTYDQQHRIKTSNSYASLNAEANAWGSAAMSSHQTNYSYDPNGNITSLNRAAGAIQYDNLSYTYPVSAGRLQNNKLRAVTENISAHSLTNAGDISANINYLYDHNGNITHENGTESQWTSTGRIKQYGAHQHYTYDAAQRRVIKTNSNSTQFYVYDATGNILALYNFRNDSLFWTGSPIYGASRLGMYHANEQLTSIATGHMTRLSRGKTEYELTNHLGDVIATITDKKLTPTDGSSYSSDIIAAQEYLPFGMQMPGRIYASTTEGYVENYPFGYNGMERDKKESADGYTTEFRQYDSRIGRWKAIDPKSQKYPSDSPFSFGNNNPTLFVDGEGDEPDPVCTIVRVSVGGNISVRLNSPLSIGGSISLSRFTAFCPSGTRTGWIRSANLDVGVASGAQGGVNVGLEISRLRMSELSNVISVHVAPPGSWGIDIPTINREIRGLNISYGRGFGERVSVDTPIGTTVVDEDTPLPAVRAAPRPAPQPDRRPIECGMASPEPSPCVPPNPDNNRSTDNHSHSDNNVTQEDRVTRETRISENKRWFRHHHHIPHNRHSNPPANPAPTDSYGCIVLPNGDVVRQNN